MCQASVASRICLPCHVCQPGLVDPIVWVGWPVQIVWLVRLVGLKSQISKNDADLIISLSLEK